MRSTLQELLVIGVVFSALFATARARCPIGAVQGMAADDCLTFFTAPTDWYAAEETCSERGGHLTSITSGSANLFIRKQAKEHQWSGDYWTGGSDAGGDWVWSDGAPFEYRRWAKGQCALGDALCISPNASTGLWNAASCYESKPFVCKFPAISSSGPSPKPKPKPGPSAPHNLTCEEDWTYSEVTEKCYKVVKDPQKDAWGQQICNKVSASVLSIHSPLENDVALNISAAQTSVNQGAGVTVGVTIGLHRPNGKWEWVDGSPVDYTNRASDGEFKFCSQRMDCFAVFQMRVPIDGRMEGKLGQWVGYDVAMGWATICVKAPS